MKQASITALLLFTGACIGDGTPRKDALESLGEHYRVSKIVAGVAPGDDNAARMCRGFILSEKNLRAFLGKARPVSDKQLHDEFDWAPCYVRATLSVGTHTALVEVSASGIASIRLDGGAPEKLGCASECDSLLSGK
ncbi:hypothetical protein D0B54_17870 [Solimonas sp. K1W22B-7]|uniref:hypothetical protein n=1 Tax=Solimonas sp. K1W22B-7 TaxID=2303331 RepID=UPI000E337A12|nr:hypothetical protein [Solimonas sp. K1W22B-7]AXQ30428.1 hypothetical protein D0B54_17870 [Solimonas sp. K1W22B-7]